jgi:hypothetical protein
MLLVQPELFVVRVAPTESVLAFAATLSLIFGGALRSQALAPRSPLVNKLNVVQRKRECDMRGNLVPCSAPSIEEEL